MKPRLWERLRNFWSREVPAELAACEFDCREVECLTKDFLNCPRRGQKAEALKRVEEEEAVQKSLVDWLRLFKDEE